MTMACPPTEYSIFPLPAALPLWHRIWAFEETLPSAPIGSWSVYRT